MSLDPAIGGLFFAKLDDRALVRSAVNFPILDELFDELLDLMNCGT